MTDVRGLLPGSTDAKADGLKGIVSSSGETIISRARTLTNTLNQRLALLLGALLLIAVAPLQGHAQFVQIKLDELVVSTPADNSSLNNCDEIFFVLAGASDHKGPIQNPRIAPSGTPNYFALCAGQRAQSINLWQGFVGDGQSAYLTFLVREQDKGLPIDGLVADAAARFGEIFINPGGGAVNDLRNAASAFVGVVSAFDLSLSLSNIDADKLIGAFTVRITNQNHYFTVSWDTIRDMNITSLTMNSARLQAHGASSSYSLGVSFQPLVLPKLVNKLSGKCLDVAWASTADQAQLQQYTCHGGNNQRWYLGLPLGVGVALPYAYVAPYYPLANNNSGKCLDIPGGSTADGMPLQQYTCNSGANQGWYLFHLGGGDYAIMNANSRKCLDVAWGSTADGATVQQYTCNNGNNQRWRFQP